MPEDLFETNRARVMSDDMHASLDNGSHCTASTWSPAKWPTRSGM